MMRCQTQRFHVRPLFCCVVAPLKAFLLLVGVAKALQVNIKVRCGCAMRWVMAHGRHHEHITHWFVTSQTLAITFYMCNIQRWRRWTCQGSNASSTHFRLGEFGLPLLPYDAITAWTHYVCFARFNYLGSVLGYLPGLAESHFWGVGGSGRNLFGNPW